MQPPSLCSSTFSLENFLPSLDFIELECPPSPPINFGNLKTDDKQCQPPISREESKQILAKTIYTSSETINKELSNKHGRYASLPPTVVINEHILHSFFKDKCIKNEYSPIKEVLIDTACPIKIFLTYSLDSENHYKDIIKIKETLEKTQNFHVIMDAFDQEKMAKDIYGWMNKSYMETDFIVPIISPLYKEATNSDPINSTNDHMRQTRYIYGMIQKEIYESSLKNKRIRPLYSSITNANRSHVPYELSNTIIYQWPREANEFISLIKKTHQINKKKMY